MPIASYVHEEMKDMPKGSKPHFIIQTQIRDFSKKRLDVQFQNGVARTTNELKAKRFSEEFGYEVIIPSGYERWAEFVHDGSAEHGSEYEPEETIKRIDD